MADQLTIFKTGAAPSTKFQGADLPDQRLDEGVSAGFPRVSYKGSKWGIRYQGAYTPIMARMGDGSNVQSPFLDVVILRASGHSNKAWYAGAYQEGVEGTPPDCYSSDGQKPDAAAPNKQHPTCNGCRNNAWGTKLNRDTGEMTKGKACMDSKRLAVVPVGDILNEMYGGPMMLSVPPSSLKKLGPYQNLLKANGFHYAAVWTRITFEPESAYPLFSFDAIAALNDKQADQVLSMIKHPQIDRILNAESSTVEEWAESTPSIHSSIDTSMAAAANAPVDPAAQPTPPPPSVPAPAPVPAAAAVPEPDEPQAEQPTPTLPPGVTLPAGMTPEMAAAFMANFQPQTAAPKRTRKPRTPPVSPTPSVSGPALPTPSAVAATPAPAPNGAAPVAAGDPVASIMSTIGNLL